VAGFTLHIDSHQGRPGWQGKSEKEHNELRQQYADLVAAEGGMVVVFNSTVYPSTFHEIPEVVRWAQANVDRVNGVVFITYRTAATDATVGFDTGKQEVDMGKLSYVTQHFDDQFTTAPEVYHLIQDNFPEYDASCYLGGTLRHDSFKWLDGALIGSKRRMFGSVGKQTMEVAQAGHHLFTGTYLAYLSCSQIGPYIFLMGFWDPHVRQAWRQWIGDVLRNPLRLFEPLYVQSVGIIQAPDIQPNGIADMCDSCPDMTVYDGKLINSCRMDEYRLFGGLLTVKERDEQSLDL
jgi:hypothetical protein